MGALGSAREPRAAVCAADPASADRLGHQLRGQRSIPHLLADSIAGDRRTEQAAFGAFRTCAPWSHRAFRVGSFGAYRSGATASLHQTQHGSHTHASGKMDNIMRKFSAVLALIALLFGGAVQVSHAADWKADAAGSKLEFFATFEGSPVPGVFKDFDTRLRL